MGVGALLAEKQGEQTIFQALENGLHGPHGTITHATLGNPIEGLTLAEEMAPW
jgi:hypothetical protein